MRVPPAVSVSRVESVLNVVPSPKAEGSANGVVLSYAPPMPRDASNVVVAASSLRMLEMPLVAGTPFASTSARARLRLL